MEQEDNKAKQQWSSREGKRGNNCLSIFPGIDIGQLKLLLSAHSIPGMPQDQELCLNWSKANKVYSNKKSTDLKQATEKKFQALQRRQEILRSK